MSIFYLGVDNSATAGGPPPGAALSGETVSLDRALDPVRLTAFAQKHRKDYSEAKPFPHMYVDGLFPESFLREVSKEFPRFDSEKGCLVTNNACFNNKDDGKQFLKSALEDESQMGYYTRALFNKMKSPDFMHFLENLTGIENIVADPYFRGSGLHYTARGGNLNIHADFNRYSIRKLGMAAAAKFYWRVGGFNLDRRVNTFVFLNEDPWPESYGGHLELWSKDMTSCYQRILPKFGRFVAFSSTDFSYHGHPTALTTPEGIGRRSMALYYYTNPDILERPREECLGNDCSGNGHSTLFKTPVGCSRCEEATCARFEHAEL